MGTVSGMVVETVVALVTLTVGVKVNVGCRAGDRVRVKGWQGS